MENELERNVTNDAFVVFPVGDPTSAPNGSRRPLLWLVLLTVGVATLSLLLAPAFGMSASKYTAWATAVQAFGTVMAFAAAAVAFGWQWARERDLIQSSIQAESRSQAARVYGWLTTTPEDPNSDASGLPPFKVRICNRSHLPVYKAVLEIVDGRNPGEPVLLSTLPEWTHPLDMVPPMSMITAELPNHGGAMGWRPALQVSFSDAAGRHWIRHSSGPLVQLVQPAWMSKNSDMSWSWEGILTEGAIAPL